MNLIMVFRRFYQTHTANGNFQYGKHQAGVGCYKELKCHSISVMDVEQNTKEQPYKKVILMSYKKAIQM